MKVAEFRALNPEELARQLEETHEELFNLRFRLSTRQLVNNCEVRMAKKKIALLKTIIRERELGIR